ncbi:MAG: hypothetical protein Q4A55_05335 [Aerococcus sp.]|nr:hypothetical protein [Aerococcus sp.]
MKENIETFGGDKENEVLSVSATKDQKAIKATTDNETTADILEKMQADTHLTQVLKQDLKSHVRHGRWFSKPIDEQNKE